MADQFATESEVERGQQALLHGEISEAVRHLGQAYERGARSPRGLHARPSAAAKDGGAGALRELARDGDERCTHVVGGVSADGKRVLTASDQDARMWGAASGQLLLTVNHGGGTVR